MRTTFQNFLLVPISQTLNFSSKPINDPKHPRFKMNTTPLLKLRSWLAVLALALAGPQLRAADYHVATAQALQSALSAAAASSVSNNIYVTNGYYLGNFNYSSSAANSLTILAEPGLTNTQITIDSGGTGSSMNIIATTAAAITVQGMAFLRNCGSTTLGGLQIAGGNTTILVNNCLFLSPTNSSGIGLEITSGLNATVTNCVAVGATNGAGGAGISISDVTNNVTVQNCTITSNTAAGLLVGGVFNLGTGVLLVAGSLFTGNSVSGGADCNAGTIIFSGNTFSGNSSNDGVGGAGAQCNGTTITLSSNTFNGNSEGGMANGAGVFCIGTTITLSGNAFNGNSGGNAGGGAYCQGTALTLSGNTFNGNSGGNGGGAYCYSFGRTILSNNTFTGNSASTYGGGAYCNGAITASENNFQRNTSGSGDGGGLYVTGPTVNLLNNLVAMNAATNTSSQGGGIWVNATSNLFMINNTVTGNTSSGSGGGLACVVTGTEEKLNVYNNIIWGNTASVNGGDVFLSGAAQTEVFVFNDADSMSGQWDTTQNNIDLAPQFFDQVNGDYHTQSTSSCIAAGTTNAPSLPATDLDGNPRIINGAVDMGCYEFTTNVFHPADVNGDWVITPAEFNAYAAAWKNGQSWPTGPSPVSANYTTRAGYLMTNNNGAYHNDGSARPVNWKTNP
jgi:hypothetical protein